MDDFKLPMISRAIYDEVAELVSQGKSCTSAKKAAPYIERIEFLSYGLPSRCADKIRDIASCLNEHCKRNADYESTLMHLNNALFVLETMVKDEE